MGDTGATARGQVDAFNRGQGVFVAQSGRLLLWMAVAFGLGVGLYFSLTFEPGFADWLRGWGAVISGVVIVGWVFRHARRILALPLAASLGFTVAGIHTYLAAAPVLTWRYYGPVEGEIAAIDSSASGADRLLLERVILSRDPDKIPRRVRVSVHGEQGFVDLRPGQRVMMTAHLSPPSGPAEPYGFDFRRHAWFAGIGAVGYTVTPVLLSENADFRRPLARFRHRLAQNIRDQMPDRTAPIAAAILTGDRRGISEETLQTLRDANLAHLLAISGLHMGLLTSLVFAALRLVLSCLPGLALSALTKKFAGIGALVAATAYLALSGGAVSTQRAYVLAVVMLIGVVLDRRAITLRSVAIAAILVLSLKPDGLLSPGFQMSFSATIALVAVFDGVRHIRLWRLPRWMTWAGTLVLSSAVAGTATAPYAAAHFNQVSHYGLVANVLSIPVMAAIVMPGGLIAAILSPIGLEGVGLSLMHWGLTWILRVGGMVSSWDGSVRHVVSPDQGVLMLITLGGLFTLLWKGWVRLAGLIPIVVGVVMWSSTQRPLVLISDTGALIGVYGPEGRTLSKDVGEGFTASIWLENDGDNVPQSVAFQRPGFEHIQHGIRAEVEAVSILALRGVRARDGLNECGGADVLILNVVENTERPCRVFDLATLRQTGSVAAYRNGDGLRFVTAREVNGDRPWTRQMPAPVSIP